MNGLMTWDDLQSTAESIKPRDKTGFEKFTTLFESKFGSGDNNYYKKFYDSSFVPTFPLNAIAGGLIVEQVIKVYFYLI